MQKNIILLFITLAISFISIQAEDFQLKDDYTISRITGGPHKEFISMINLDIDGEFIASFISHYYRNGRADSYQVGAQLFNLSWIGNSFIDAIGVSFVDWQLKTNEGHQLFVKFNLPQTYFYFGEDAGTGFEEDGPIMVNEYKSIFLTNDGKIELKEAENELAFLYGPLLGKFQYKQIVDFSHDLFGNWDINKFSYAGKFGITDRHQIGFDIAITKMPLSFGDMNYSSYYYSEYYKPEYNTDINFSYEYRSEAFRIGVSMPDPASEITLSGSYLLNKRSVTGEQVNGNWDGYFSDNLGKNQLLTELLISATPFDFFDKDVKYSYKTSILGLKYGVNDIVTASSTFGYSWADSLFTGNLLGMVGLSLSNIKLREYGPSEVSAAEYHFGYIPKEGEIKASINYLLPTNEYETTVDSLTKIIYSNLYNGSMIDYIAMLASGINPYYANDLKASIQYGITNRFFIQSNYGLLINKFEHFADLKLGFHSKKSIFSISFAAMSQVKSHHSYYYDDFGNEEVQTFGERNWDFGPLTIEYKSSF